MAHTIIVGQTESGKTTYAISLAERYINKGYKVIVLDPLLDQRWKCTILTCNKSYFFDIVKNPLSQNLAVFIDESSESLDRYNNDGSNWLATRSRHYGHNVTYITQRYIGLNKTVRDQASYCVMFKVGSVDRRSIELDFCCETQINDPLKKGEYYCISRYAGIKKGNAFNNKGREVKKYDYATSKNYGCDRSHSSNT